MNKCFLSFFPKKKTTGIIILHQRHYKLQLTIYRIYYFYYVLFIQLSELVAARQREPYRYSMCLSPDILYFSFYVSLCLVNMLSIILCTMSNKILPYHTILL